VEIEQLRLFVVVAGEMHVGRAAQRLHLAQPTLSRQIAALERDLGVELFSRARRRLRLTTAGEVFLEHARALLQHADLATREAQRASRGEIGTLRMGFVQSATYGTFPRLASAFRSACPDVRLEATSMTTLQQLPALHSGALDVGLLRPQQPAIVDTSVCTRVVSRDRLVAVLPQSHPLASGRRVELAALAGDAFVLYPNERGATGHGIIVDACVRAGFSPHTVQEARDAQTVVALVAAGLGVSLLLTPTPPIDPALVVYRPLADPMPTWDMALAWSADNTSTVLARFLAVAADVVDEPRARDS
jgi:DNA-binding transcriptional LysR family regulator